MFGYDAPRLHAVLNDLPAALLFVAVLFDLAGWLLKRESLRWAGLWTLWAGVVGGWAAVVTGTLAEEAIDHGEAIHELMERHELFGRVTMIVFTVALVWKLWRRVRLAPWEEWGVRALGVVGLVWLVLTANAGGRLVFEHAAGVPTERMKAELIDRDAIPPAADTAAATPRSPGGHTHAPGTPPHER